MVLGIIYITFTGKSKWSGRSMTLLDPTYAKKYIPIIYYASKIRPEINKTGWNTCYEE